MKTKFRNGVGRLLGNRAAVVTAGTIGFLLGATGFVAAQQGADDQGPVTTMAAAGTTKSLAVSNFSPPQLDVIASVSKTMPTVNQLPYGVGFARYYNGKAAEIVAENKKRGVVVQAWSPLQKALKGKNEAACAEIGKRYEKTAAQVALRWIIDTGCTLTTAGTTKVNGAKGRFRENIDIYDFQLSKEEVATLSAL